MAGTAADTLALHVIDVPLAGSAQLTVSAQPSFLYAGQQTTLTGRLAAATGAPLGGVAVNVTRAATGAAPASLKPVVTQADGSFTVVDTPPTAGSWAYTVSNPADAAVAGATVFAWATDTRLTLTAKPDGAGVYGALTFDYDGPDSTTGRTVAITRTGGGVVVALPDVTVDSWGAGKFLDSPRPGHVEYTRRWRRRACTRRRPRTARSCSRPGQRRRSPSTCRRRRPPAPPCGSAVSCRPPACPWQAATVTVRRSGCGTSWTAAGTTTPNGAWSVTDAAPPVGTCTYSASYAGSSSNAPATVTGTTTVSLRPTALTAAAASGLAGSPLAVSGVLSSGTAAVVGGRVSVVRSGCTATTWAGTATTAADGSWSATDPAPPGGTCTYRATSAATATDASASATATTTVARRETSLSVSVVRGTGNAKKSVVVTGLLGDHAHEPDADRHRTAGGRCRDGADLRAAGRQQRARDGHVHAEDDHDVPREVQRRRLVRAGDGGEGAVVRSGAVLEAASCRPVPPWPVATGAGAEMVRGRAAVAAC